MPGLIGKKIGMTSVFTEKGNNIPCTVVQVGPCVVTQIKTLEKDGYKSIQLGFDDKKEKNTVKPLIGHFKKAKTLPKRKLIEFSDFSQDIKLGDTLTVNDVFEEDIWVDVTGTSKGKGFQGVVKRHGFKGVGDATHGQHNRARSPGSIGAASYPARVFKGMKMAGRTGGERTTIQNLKILKVISENNLLVIQGAVPGHKGNYLIIRK